MGISSLTIQNFKSINHATMQFGAFDVLIGANASGKTNIVQAVKFLKDLVREDMDNALSLQGGMSYVVNSQLRNTKETTIEVVYTTDGLPFTLATEPDAVLGLLYDLTYRLELLQPAHHHPIMLTEYIQGRVHTCTSHHLPVELELIEQELNRMKKEQAPFEYIAGEVHSGGTTVTYTHQKEHYDPAAVYTERIPPAQGALRLVNSSTDFGQRLQTMLTETGLYAFSTDKMKQEGSLLGRKDLESDGSNLTLVLKNLLGDEEKRHQFLLLLEYVLPFIKDVQVESLHGRSLMAVLTETYDSTFSLPSVFFSEGTISVIALVLALFFEEKSVVIIEEPERYIHPSLLAKLVDLMKDASQKKQVIVTTHSPELVKHAGIEHLLLVQRDKEGFTTVSRPETSEIVRTFLQSDIGLDNLYIDNLLGV